MKRKKKGRHDRVGRGGFVSFVLRAWNMEEPPRNAHRLALVWNPSVSSSTTMGPISSQQTI